MDSTPASTYIQQFIDTIGDSIDPHVEGRLHQSSNACLSYYRCLHIILDLYRPAVTPYMWQYFAPFARAVLDALAETFCVSIALQWSRAEISHTRLTNAFPNICTERRLQGEAGGLHARMRELDTRLTPSSTNSDQYWTPPSPHSAATSLHERLADLLTCIDQYIVALLRFLEHNINRVRLEDAPARWSHYVDDNG